MGACGEHSAYRRGILQGASQNQVARFVQGNPDTREVVLFSLTGVGAPFGDLHEIPG
jgi:hypothetical protein